MINSFARKITSLLRLYYYVGGMPEAAAAFLERGLLEDARSIQNQILSNYERDVSKHLSRTESEYAIAAWRSIPLHLGRENKKFVFGHIAQGARARNYQSGITWLEQAGLVTKVRRISKPGLPLCPYADDAAFKLFLLDVGLLGAMVRLNKSTVIGGSAIFEEFKGALTEQYVCQQLVSECGLTPYYWSAENSSGEIDFLAQGDNQVYAIEVKAEENLRSKSLRAFKQKHPWVSAVRFSMSGFREQDWMPTSRCTQSPAKPSGAPKVNSSRKGPGLGPAPWVIVCLVSSSSKAAKTMPKAASIRTRCRCSTASPTPSRCRRRASEKSKAISTSSCRRSRASGGKTAPMARSTMRGRTTSTSSHAFVCPISSLARTSTGPFRKLPPKRIWTSRQSNCSGSTRAFAFNACTPGHTTTSRRP